MKREQSTKYYRRADGTCYKVEPVTRTEHPTLISKAEYDAYIESLPHHEHHEKTEAEKEALRKRQRIEKLKHSLSLTDYQAIKHSEGWISDEDYASIKAERQSLRDEINELEEALK